MTRPEISIIVPVYNVGETLLRPCIESALGQTFTDFELILVDDASTDNSAAICASYSDPRIRLLRLPENGGLANARNQGITISTGLFITFLDADDQLHPRALEIFRNIERHTNADIVAAGLSRDAAKQLRCIPSQVMVFSPTEAIADTLYQHHLNNSACGKLYRRKICEAESFRSGWYEDLRTFPHMFLRANKVAWTPAKLYVYTDNPASYLHTFNAGRAVALNVTDELVDFMEKNYPELVAAARDRALSAAFNIYLLLRANRLSEPQIEARCKSTIRRYRRASLFNPRVRLKNKFGILVTYLGGFRLLRAVARLHPDF